MDIKEKATCVVNYLQTLSDKHIASASNFGKTKNAYNAFNAYNCITNTIYELLISDPSVNFRKCNIDYNHYYSSMLNMNKSNDNLVKFFAKLYELLIDEQFHTFLDESYKKLYYNVLLYKYYSIYTDDNNYDQPYIEMFEYVKQNDAKNFTIRDGREVMILTNNNVLGCEYMASASDYIRSIEIIQFLPQKCLQFLHEKVYNRTDEVVNPMLLQCMNDLDNIQQMIDAI